MTPIKTPTITRHRIGADAWSTCNCGWTSSPTGPHVDHQIAAHLKWCEATPTRMHATPISNRVSRTEVTR